MTRTPTAVTPARTRAASAGDAVDLTERIEQVATELFIRNGYHGTSYLGIAKELGITHSNVHYYYRNKSALAEAVLRRVGAETLNATSVIWGDPDTTLVEKFVRMRDWIYGSYLQFNPDGKGGRPWGLLSRFSMEADALTPEMKQIIRTTLKKLESDVRFAVETARRSGEIAADSPVDGITLQVASVMYLTGQATRYAAGFSRLDDLLRWTITTLCQAYGSERGRTIEWPAVGSRRSAAAVRQAA